MSLFLEAFERIFHKALSFAASHSTWKVNLGFGNKECDLPKEDQRSPFEEMEV